MNNNKGESEMGRSAMCACIHCHLKGLFKGQSIVLVFI